MMRPPRQIQLSTCLLLVGLAAVVFAQWKNYAEQKPVAITGVPVSITLKQRSTTSIPGASDELSLALGDITSGQVMVTLSDKSKKVLLGPLSMKQGDSEAFRLRDSDYVIELTELNNALIGDDFASFLIDEGSGSSLTESQKIDQLIKAVETLPDAVFIRNGTDYSASEAAKHLRRKREATEDDVRTAENFIELVASESSITGKEYSIRFADGRTMSAKDFLRDKLANLEASGEPTHATEPAAGSVPSGQRSAPAR